MSARSLSYWSALCDAKTASKAERASATLVAGVHRRVSPVIGMMRSESRDGASMTLEQADECLDRIYEILDFVKLCGKELTAINFDNNSQVQTAIFHVQEVAYAGLFASVDLLRSEAAKNKADLFTADNALVVIHSLQNTLDWVDIASGEPMPSRMQAEEAEQIHD